MTVSVADVRDMVARAGGSVITRTEVLASSLGLAHDRIPSCLADGGLQVVAFRDHRLMVALSDDNLASRVGTEPEPLGDQSSPLAEPGLRDISPEGSGPDSSRNHPIDELELPVRAYRILMRSGLREIEDLASASDEELLELEGLGATSLRDIREALRSYGLPGDESSHPARSRVSDVPSEECRLDSARNRTIDELELPARAYRILVGAGLRQIADVACASDEELLELEGLGATSLLDIREALRSYGVSSRNDTKMSPRPQGQSDRAVEPVLSASDAALQMARVAREAAAAPLRDRASDYAAALTLCEHADRPVTHLERLCLRAVDRVGARAIVVLDLRMDHTLADVGRMLAVSRERVRQIEDSVTEKLHLDFVVDAVLAGLADTLSTEVLDETRIAEELGGGGGWSSTNFVKVVLRLLGLQNPRGFAARLSGYWTAEPYCVVERLTRASHELPFPEGDLANRLMDLDLPPDFPIDVVAAQPGSPIRLHPVLNLWVRASAVHRDAAWLLLKKHGKPVPADALADLLRIKRHAMSESLRRDERFHQERPSGLWGLAEWGGGPAYASTLDAARASLRERGPMWYDEFEREVIRRYRVSSAAVRQTLISVEIGKWPDGRIDLRARGAPAFPEPMPRLAPTVSVDDDDEQLRLVIDVTHDVLRGSGTQIPPYVTWWLGLREAPTAKTFDSGLGRIVVRRNLGGAAVSSLREAAKALGAAVGCRLVLTLRKGHNNAKLELACLDHFH